MFNILVCDDDKEIVDAIDIYLSQEGYHILKAYDGLQAIEIMKKEEVHLILLDIMMPNLDGIRATRKIRETSSVPIIMLSAKSEEVDKITGLNIGADDYVTKPFTPMELMARVNSQLRRYRKFLEKLAPQENTHVIGGLEINEDMVEVSMDGNPVKLTPIEYKLLCLLAHNADKVLTHQFILHEIWGTATKSDLASLRVFMGTLRKKIESDPAHPRYIQTHVGIGYRLVTQG